MPDPYRDDPDDPMRMHDYDVDQLRELLIIERRNYKELCKANQDRLKRIDTLREEKLLVEDQLKSALARLETIDKINKALGSRVIQDDADLQLACMALAECALRRPGFEYAITELAGRLGGEHAKQLLTAFKKTSGDLVKPLGDEFLGVKPQ